jgi:hypothetical protein
MTEATIDQSAKDSWEKVLNKIIEDSDMVMLSNAADAAPESDALLMEQARGMLHQFAMRTAEGKILSNEKKGLLKAMGDAIARIDAELGHRLGQLMRRLPEAGTFLARPARPGQVQRNRPAPEAAPAQRQQDRNRRRPEQGGRRGPEPVVQEDL